MSGPSKKQRYASLLDEQGPHCIYCKEKMLEKHRLRDGVRTPKRFPTIEHVIPLCYHGTWSLTNLVLACYECNHIKGNASIRAEAITPSMADLFLSREIKKYLVYPETGDPTQHLITKQQLLTKIEWSTRTWHTVTRWNSSNLLTVTPQ